MNELILQPVGKVTCEPPSLDFTRIPPGPPYNDGREVGHWTRGLGNVKYYKYPRRFWGPVGWPSHFWCRRFQKPHWTPYWTRRGCESSGVLVDPMRLSVEGPPWPVASLLPASVEGVGFGESWAAIQSHSRLLCGAPKCLESLTRDHFLQRLGTCSCARYINAHVLVST